MTTSNFPDANWFRGQLESDRIILRGHISTLPHGRSEAHIRAFSWYSEAGQDMACRLEYDVFGSGPLADKAGLILTMFPAWVSERHDFIRDELMRWAQISAQWYSVKPILIVSYTQSGVNDEVVEIERSPSFVEVLYHLGKFQGCLDTILATNGPIATAYDHQEHTEHCPLSPSNKMLLGIMSKRLAGLNAQSINAWRQVIGS